jgi:hypothetical protein
LRFMASSWTRSSCHSNSAPFFLDRNVDVRIRLLADGEPTTKADATVLQSIVVVKVKIAITERRMLHGTVFLILQNLIMALCYFFAIV